MASPPPRSRPPMAMVDDPHHRPPPIVARHYQKPAYEASIPEHSPSPQVHATTPSRDSVISHPFSPKIPSPPSPSSVTSSAVRHHARHAESQRSSHHNIAFPPTARVDLEKQNVFPQSPQPHTYVSLSDPGVPIRSSRKGSRDEEESENVLPILIFLAGPCAIFSFLLTLWTGLALLLTLILQPLRFCSFRPTFNEQVAIFLAPPLNTQLRIIHSNARSIQYRASMLVLVHTFAPFVAVGVAVASWVAACFWFFSAILGDPAGQDGHNDGRATVLGVRNWWERWLVRALTK